MLEIVLRIDTVNGDFTPSVSTYNFYCDEVPTLRVRNVQKIDKFFDGQQGQDFYLVGDPYKLITIDFRLAMGRMDNSSFDTAYKLKQLYDNVLNYGQPAFCNVFYDYKRNPTHAITTKMMRSDYMIMLREGKRAAGDIITIRFVQTVSEVGLLYSPELKLSGKG